MDQVDDLINKETRTQAANAAIVGSLSILYKELFHPTRFARSGTEFVGIVRSHILADPLLH
jgi:hypothetical protein